MVTGTTISSATSDVCEDCGITSQVVEVTGLHPGSTALVYFCGCGPHSPDSGFYAIRREAEVSLARRDSDGLPEVPGHEW